MLVSLDCDLKNKNIWRGISFIKDVFLVCFFLMPNLKKRKITGVNDCTWAREWKGRTGEAGRPLHVSDCRRVIADWLVDWFSQELGNKKKRLECHESSPHVYSSRGIRTAFLSRFCLFMCVWECVMDAQLIVRHTHTHSLTVYSFSLDCNFKIHGCQNFLRIWICVPALTHTHTHHIDR